MEIGSAAFGLAVVALSLAAVRFSAGRGTISGTLSMVRAEWRWLVLLALAFLANWSVSRLGFASPLVMEQAAPWSLDVLQNLQSLFPAELAVPLFAFAYLALFPALLLALPLALLVRGEAIDLRRLCLALAITYAGLVALHLLFLSSRPSLTPGSGVAPLLYGDPIWGELSYDLGSRGNSFPSGHTASVTAMTVVLFDRKGLRPFLIAALGIIVLGVLYLGLHWPLDVMGGLLLGSVAGLAARRYVRMPSSQMLDRREPRI